MSTFEFHTHTTRFKLINALRLAQCSKLVYGSKSKIKSQMLDTWKFKEFKYFEEVDTQAFIAANDEILIVSFRGTHSVRDWMTNANARLVKSTVGKIHNGFNIALNEVWSDMKSTIKDWYSPKRRLFLTGHSLGGALATLASERLLKDDFDINGVYTYGQPRVGNTRFVKNLNALLKSRFFRFINNEDYVTRVPPRIAGYKHIGTPRYIDIHGKIHRNNILWHSFHDDAKTATIRSLDRFRELRHKYPRGADDHSMEYYIKYIRKNMLKKPGFTTFEEFINQ